MKVRLMSPQSFPWNRKLKTCEEASGITGSVFQMPRWWFSLRVKFISVSVFFRFVRCIDTDVENNEINLDTSPNARFHQCCLVWQHPFIPWLDLYPRIEKKTLNSSNLSVLPAKDEMYKNWVDSFRSLFQVCIDIMMDCSNASTNSIPLQLIRAKQCPYFYLITNSFLCLFRAAGINGYTEMNASITPTSRGFRQLLKEEGTNIFDSENFLF